MRSCCICGTGWKTIKREDTIIYGCANCEKGSHIVNTRNMPPKTKFGQSPHLTGREAVDRVNAKLKEWNSSLRWSIKEKV